MCPAAGAQTPEPASSREILADLLAKRAAQRSQPSLVIAPESRTREWRQSG